MGRILTNEEWQNARDAVYQKCTDVGIPQDAGIMAYINNIYLRSDGKVRKYLSESPKVSAATIALDVHIISENDLNMVKKGMQGATEDIMSNIWIAAREGVESYTEKRPEFQKILLWTDMEYRKEILAEYYSVIGPTRHGPVKAV